MQAFYTSYLSKWTIYIRQQSGGWLRASALPLFIYSSATMNNVYITIITITIENITNTKHEMWYLCFCLIFLQKIIWNNISISTNVFWLRWKAETEFVTMGLLPDTQNCGCACAGNAGNVFPVTAGKRSRHASRHVRHARAVMHAGIANLRYPLKSAAGENVPGIPGACATCNFTYLVRGPWNHDGYNIYAITETLHVNIFKPK